MPSAFGSFQCFKKTAATGATSVTFDFGGAYDSYLLMVPSMPSGSNIQFRVSDSASGTYRTLFTDTEVGTSPAASAPVAFAIPSSISNCGFQIPHLGQYAQLVLTSATTIAGGNAYEFVICCSTM
jgi:hypothetical protein